MDKKYKRATVGSSREIWCSNRETGRFHEKLGDSRENRESWQVCIYSVIVYLYYAKKLSVYTNGKSKNSKNKFLDHFTIFLLLLHSFLPTRIRALRVCFAAILFVFHQSQDLVPRSSHSLSWPPF